MPGGAGVDSPPAVPDSRGGAAGGAGKCSPDKHGISKVSDSGLLKKSGPRSRCRHVSPPREPLTPSRRILPSNFPHSLNIYSR